MFYSFFNMCRLTAVTIVVGLWAASICVAQTPEAPSWQGTEWINLPSGKQNLDVSDFRDRVVYLSFFQKW